MHFDNIRYRPDWLCHYLPIFSAALITFPVIKAIELDQLSTLTQVIVPAGALFLVYFVLSSLLGLRIDTVLKQDRMMIARTLKHSLVLQEGRQLGVIPKAAGPIWERVLGIHLKILRDKWEHEPSQVA